MPRWCPDSRIPVALLGATGLVGQAIALRLLRHPWFDLAAVAASPGSVGLRYGDAARGGSSLPAELADRRLVRCDPTDAGAPIVLSALDAATAREVEPRFAAAGSFVVSNASAFRMEADVPLVVPEINPGHLALLARQRAERGWAGGIICNPNCVAAIVGLALAPLQARWGIRAASVTTLQSASGAGHPGVSALDLLGNVIPFIDGEEEKIAAELDRMLGTATPHGIEPAGCAIGAQSHRVAVPFGHLAAVSVGLESAVTPEMAASAMREWRGSAEVAGLPTLPDCPIDVTALPDRPQPRFDLGAGNGMTVTVGRLRPDPVLGLRFVVLGDNLIRGAAGAALANAELAVRVGEAGVFGSGAGVLAGVPF